MNITQQIVALLKNGKLIAIPTETVYGLGADAKNPAAIQRIYEVKGRPITNPLIIHIPNSDAMQAFAIDIPTTAKQLARAFWPGPLTLILKRHPSVPLVVTAGQETVALRVPNHPLTLAILEAFGGGIAAPSANRSGHVSPTTTEHVRDELGTAVDYILEGGACQIGIESTIVDLSSDTPTILRPGSISQAALEAVLGCPVLYHQNPTIQVPGNSLSHYAPLQPLYLLSFQILMHTVEKLLKKSSSFSVLSFEPKPLLANTPLIEWIMVDKDPVLYAQQLYHHLHAFDKTTGCCILVESPPNTLDWNAIIDRLQRAHSPTSLLF